MMKKKASILVLFLLGLGVVAYPHIAQYVNNYQQHKQVHQFKEQAEEMPAADIDRIIEAANACNQKMLSERSGFHDPFAEDGPEQLFNTCPGLGVINSNTGDGTTDDKQAGIHIGEEGSFAAIDIPKLNVEIPIYLGASPYELAIGVGRVEGTSLPVGGPSTHTVLAGHRGMSTKAMFRDLDQLTEGDEFYIYTVDEKLTYQVIEIEVILPYQTSNLEIVKNKDRASLVTCHPYGNNTHRLVVQGERKK